MDKKRRRRGIAERATYLLLFTLLLNLSFAALNAAGWFNVKVKPNPAYNVGPVQTQAQCQTISVGTTAANCSPSVGDTASIVPSILIFGDWFGGLISLVFAFGQGLLIPGWFLFQFGVPAVWVALFTAGMYVDWFLLLLWMRTKVPL